MIWSPQSRGGDLRLPSILPSSGCTPYRCGTHALYTIAITSLTLGHILSGFLNAGEFTPQQVAKAAYPESSYRNASGQIIGAWAVLRLLGDPVVAPSATEPSFAPDWALATVPDSFNCAGVLQKLYDDRDQSIGPPHAIECTPNSVASWLMALYAETFQDKNPQTFFPQPHHAAITLGFPQWASDPTHLARIHDDIAYAFQQHPLTPNQQFRLSPFSQATACVWLSKAIHLQNDYEAFRSWWETHNVPALDVSTRTPPEGKPHLKNLTHSLLVLLLDGDPELRTSAAVVFRTLWNHDTIYYLTDTLHNIIGGAWQARQGVENSSKRTVWNDTPTLLSELESAFGPDLCDLPGASEVGSPYAWARARLGKRTWGRMKLGKRT